MIWATAALAGGYFYSDSGVVATGRGGAFIAGAEGQFSQYYNPAGLIRTEHPTFNVGLSFVQQHTTFDRLGPDGEYLPTVKNQAPPFTVPQGGFVTPLFDGKAALAIGFVSPFAPSGGYTAEGAQRYSIVDSGVYQFSYGPSLAVRPVEWLTIGASFQAKLLIVQRSLHVSVSGRDDPGGDIEVDLSASDLFTPNANFGILIDPVPAVSIGLAAQPPTRFRATGRTTLDLTVGDFANFTDKPVYQDGRCSIETDDTCSSEDGVAVDVTLPWVIRAGVAVRPVPTVEIEAAVVWQNWNVVEETVIRDLDPEIVLTLTGEPAELPPEFAIKDNLRDTWSLRLGGHWRATDDLVLRAGGFWENGASRPETLSISLMDTNKFQVGTGASVFPFDGRLRFDASAAAIFFDSAQPRDSQLEQIYIDALGLGADPLTIGNGDLKSWGWVLGLQGSWILKGRQR